MDGIVVHIVITKEELALQKSEDNVRALIESRVGNARATMIRQLITQAPPGSKAVV